MLEFQEKKKRKKWLYSIWTIIVLLLLAITGIDAVWGIYKKEAESRKNLSEAEQSLDRLKDRHDTLTTQVNRLSTPRGIEEEIRNTFSVVKDGEQVAIIVDSAEKPTTTPEVVAGESFWQRIVRWFKGQ